MINSITKNGRPRCNFTGYSRHCCFHGWNRKLMSGYRCHAYMIINVTKTAGPTGRRCNFTGYPRHCSFVRWNRKQMRRDTCLRPAVCQLRHLQLSSTLLTPLFLGNQLDARLDHGLRHEDVSSLRRVDGVEEHVAAGVPARSGRRRVAEVHPRLGRPRLAARIPRVREA